MAEQELERLEEDTRKAAEKKKLQVGGWAVDEGVRVCLLLLFGVFWGAWKMEEGTQTAGKQELLLQVGQHACVFFMDAGEWVEQQDEVFKATVEEGAPVGVSFCLFVCLCACICIRVSAGRGAHGCRTMARVRRGALMATPGSHKRPLES